MRPAEHRGHARDLSALIDLVRHSCVEVGTRRKQRVQVGHLAVLIDEAVDPVEAGVQRASHHLAAVVDPGAYGGKISRQSAEVCECAVHPKRGKYSARTINDPNNLALVVNALGGSAKSEVLKLNGGVAFPRNGAKTAPGDSPSPPARALLAGFACQPPPHPPPP